MAKIDTSGWKEFVIGDLFEISRPVARSQAKYEEGNVPFVASGNFNNGVTKWCTPQKDEILDAGNCITVSPLDGSSFYQKESFLGRGGAGSAILLLRNKNLSELSGLFISAAIRRSLTKYTYSDQLNSQTIADESIYLPTDAAGNPDWDYMARYMQEIIRESETCLENLRLADTSQNPIDTSAWKKFLIEDLFEKLDLKIKKEDFNKSRDVSEERDEEFSLPLVNAKHGNNGIMYFGRDCDFESAEMTIGIVQNGAIATGDVYAHPEKTGVLWDAYLVKPKENIQSKFVLMYLATVMEKSIKDKFSYDNKCVWDKAKQLTISLPADPTGAPDWAYMEQFMSAMLQESELRLQNLR